ncbi:hypothetical protein BH708_05785 [Brachybacterium sp. P6-10-X1]|uniref:UPF0182 family membrane protein n=1 Tax=Brachybacterium sp. P6-10-X1 TaxID=1903186 RepID=UPI0009717708|nr:UPF0182 family protein [Brachybacterium sp. P6-10-X1]APX32315.1 hypothetical protein BH708_05785 [Brachybacterium sp. P6-10-X1]
MSFSAPLGDTPRPRPRPAPDSSSSTPRRLSPLAIAAIVVAALVILLVVASEVWTKYLWMDQLEFTDVLVVRWVTQAVLFVLGFLLFAIPLFFSLRIAYTKRPIYPPVTREQEALEQFRSAVDPLRRGLTIAAPLIIGAFGGLAASRSWQDVQLFMHPQSFGETDPVFGNDVGFYVFTLPVIDLFVSFGQFVLLVAIVGALIGHFIYGGVAWGQESGLEVTRSARRHLGVLAAIYVLVLGAGHWFQRYDMLVNQHDRFHGASYTDVHAILPAQTILAISAIVVAALFVLWIFRSDWRIPAIGAGLMILSTLAVGNLYPWAIQQFQVQPNERTLEQPYIQRNIDATRAAFNIDDVEEVSYTATTDAEPGALREDASTTAQIRLMDPNIISPTFEQREANRRYWGFEDVLSVDRYEIEGELQDTVIGVRELRPDKFDLSSRSWVDQHIIYTHGYGTAAAYGNRRNADGEPSFLQSGVPGEGAFGEYQERVYFGRHSPDYSIVGAPEGHDPEEFDYQSGTDGENAGEQVNNTFQGDGGPAVGGFLNQLLYSIKFRDPNILISDYLNEESQILYDRAPQDRVKEVAPFLSLDSQMYPAVVDDELVWVVDGYTTTDQYPYSRTVDLDSTINDSQTDPADSAQNRERTANYMRNGVKATVNAFDGSVTLYSWDTEDPILKAWEEVFPDALQPADEISGELMSHLRYPADYFKVQRELLGTYHVKQADDFFGAQDFWQIPPDPTQPAPENPDGTTGEQAAQPPMYLTMQMPGTETPRFTLSSSYIPAQGQNVLTGYLAVDSETGDTAGNPADSYGDMKLLVLPPTNPVNGPGQVQATFNSEPNVSQALNLLQSGNSEVINGNLLTLPVGGGLLYVQPVYLQSSASGGGTQYPLLQMVLVSFGDKIGFAPTLDEALDLVFGGDSGASAGDASVSDPDGASGAVDAETGEGTVDSPEGEEDTSGGDESADQGTPAGESGSAQERLDAALADMDAAVADSEEAMAAGDWAAYGEAQDRIADALNRAVAANQELGGTGTPAPSDGGGG